MVVGKEGLSVWSSPYKEPAPEPKIQKKPKKMFSFCKNCRFVHKENLYTDTSLWECRSPKEFVRNFQSGQTHYKTEYCENKNNNGECSNFAKKLPIALQKVELPSKEELLAARPSLLKRIFGRIFTFICMGHNL